MESERYCLVNNVFVKSCSKKQCPVYPCSFNDFVRDMSEFFKNKGLNRKKSLKMGRTLVLNAFQSDGKGEL